MSNRSNFFLTGISDEAGKLLSRQIEAHKELGWSEMEVRDVQVPGGEAKNLHDLSQADFEVVAEEIERAGMHVYCLSSRIANWGKQITDPFDSSLEELSRAIPRMKRLNTRFIRIMSFAVLPDTDDQMEEERFRRLRELVKILSGEGLTALHENCMNYGGMGWTFTLKLLENVPGLSLVFDTGNPVFADDRSKPRPWAKQSAWEFYSNVREHIRYVHVKDGRWNAMEKKTEFSFPGEGDAEVKKILGDLVRSGYSGGISIEPHIGAVYHDENSRYPEDLQYSGYIEYGNRLKQILKEAESAPRH